MTTDKSYEAFFKVQMPGQQKENEYRIVVKADDPVEATSNAILKWKESTEPKDIRVKEITKDSKDVKVTP